MGQRERDRQRTKEWAEQIKAVGWRVGTAPWHIGCSSCRKNEVGALAVDWTMVVVILVFRRQGKQRVWSEGKQGPWEVRENGPWEARGAGKSCLRGTCVNMFGGMWEKWRTDRTSLCNTKIRRGLSAKARHGMGSVNSELVQGKSVLLLLTEHQNLARGTCSWLKEFLTN